MADSYNLTDPNAEPLNKSWVSKISDALDYAGNISRSGIAGALTPDETYLNNAIQAAKGEKKVSATELKDLLTQKLLGRKVRFGVDNDSKLSAGDVVDVAADIGLDLATDPLNLVGTALTKIPKYAKMVSASKAVKAAPSLATLEDVKQFEKLGLSAADQAKTLAMNKLSPEIRNLAEQYDKFQTYAKPAIGGMLGLGASEDKDLTDFETLRNVGLGALAGHGVNYLAKPEVAEYMRKTVDNLYSAKPIDINMAKSMAGGEQTKFVAAEKAAYNAKGIPITPVLEREIEENSKKVYELKLQELTSPMSLSQAQKYMAYQNPDTSRIYAMIVNGQEEALKNLPVSDKLIAIEIMRKLKDQTQQITAEEIKRMVSEGKYYGKNSFDEARRIANMKVEEGLKTEGGYGNKLIKALDEEKQQSIMDAIDSMANMNKNLVKEYNGKVNKDLVGITYHVEDTFKRPKGDGTDIYDAMDNMVRASKSFRQYTGTGKGEDKIRNIMSGLTDDELKAYQKIVDAKLSPEYLQNPEAAKEIDKYFDELSEKMWKGQQAGTAKYAQQFANKFEDVVVQRAKGMLSQAYENRSPIWKAYDELNAFTKQAMLGLSLKWSLYNHADNTLKAYVDNGLVSALKSLTKPFNPTSETTRTLYNIGKKPEEIRKVFANQDEVMDAFNRGVIGNTLAGSTASEVTKALEGITPDSAFGKIGTVAKKGMEVATIPSYRLGGLFENTAKLQSYKANIKVLEDTIKKDLLDHNVATMGRKAGTLATDETIKDLAAKLTKDTFFDYKDVTHFENVVMKRLMPFYMFYSRNIPYWTSRAFDPATVGRISNVDAIQRNIGEDLSPLEQAQLPDYLRTNVPRKIGKGQKGEPKFVTFPYLSMYDAINSLNPVSKDSLLKQIEEKSNPTIKNVVEALSGEDLFTGGKYFPSENSRFTKLQRKIAPSLDRVLPGKKSLFTAGYKWNQIAPETFPIDEKGNVVTTNDLAYLLAKTQQSIIPTPVVDQIYSLIRKPQYDKQSLQDAVINLLAPAQVSSVPWESLSRNMKKEMKSK